jgi:hypothetical protein
MSKHNYILKITFLQKKGETATEAVREEDVDIMAAVNRKSLL